jgi:hypothetical protein
MGRKYRIGGDREGGSPEGLFTAEGIGDRGKTSGSRSKGHQQGPSSWGGSTRRCDAWAGVEAAGEGPERSIHGGSVMMSTTAQWR